MARSNDRQHSARMQAEIREAPEAVSRQAQRLPEVLAQLARRLGSACPSVVVTCARGSSAHAAAFGKHAIERHLGIPVAPMAPSIATIYRQRLRLEGQLFLAISQSGRSDDLIESAAMAKASRALTVALVNDTESPLARTCEFILAMEAGPELSVAATKTFIASLAALLRLTAAWTGNHALAAALSRLPDRLVRAAELDWSTALDTLSDADSLVTIGRGPTLAIAREAALKLKETCNLHAEAFSGAEFLHGPVSLVSWDYPILMFVPEDKVAPGLRALAEDLRTKGAAVLMADAGSTGPNQLPTLAPDHPDVDAICLIQSFYAMAVRQAERRGIDVDRPRHLQKVTRTR